MRISYFLQGIHFEWDSQKASENLIKHGISFHTAAESFFDPFLKYTDGGDRDGGVREQLIGMPTGRYSADRRVYDARRRYFSYYLG